MGSREEQLSGGGGVGGGGSGLELLVGESVKARDGGRRLHSFGTVWKECGCKRGIWAVGRGLWVRIRVQARGRGSVNLC